LGCCASLLTFDLRALLPCIRLNDRAGTAPRTPSRQVAALVALTGSRDPSKLDNTKVKGPAARAIVGSAAGACVMSLVCSLFDIGAIEMLVLQIMYNGIVFHFLWHGAAGPSNALVHGDYRTGHQVSSCGFCGEKVLFFPNSHRYSTFRYIYSTFRYIYSTFRA